ncbi:MAG TPA: hypothetical protein VIJ27_09460 [Mucilaginibacter sp.]
MVHIVCSFQSTVFYVRDGSGYETGKFGPACVSGAVENRSNAQPRVANSRQHRG